jgi:hypothetical protein
MGLLSRTKMPGSFLPMEERVELKWVISWKNRPKMYLILNRTEKNQKKPVETEEIRLTKRSERMKVNCGTVLRTRMNIDDFALKN